MGLMAIAISVKYTIILFVSKSLDTPEVTLCQLMGLTDMCHVRIGIGLADKYYVK